MKLSKNSTLSYIRYNRRFKILTHLIYDNKRPFVYYFDYDTGGGKDVIQNEINKFNLYKINSQSNYIVESAADSFSFYLWFIGVVVLFFMFIWTYVEDFKNKKDRNI